MKSSYPSNSRVSPKDNIDRISKDYAGTNYLKRNGTISNVLYGIDRWLMHGAMVFNLYWLIIHHGKYLNDVMTEVWLFVDSTVVTLPLTLINLLFVKDKIIKRLSWVNATLFLLLIGFSYHDPSNHDWFCFLRRCSLFTVTFSLIAILPVATISILATWAGKKLVKKFRNGKV